MNNVCLSVAESAFPISYKRDLSYSYLTNDEQVNYIACAIQLRPDKEAYLIRSNKFQLSFQIMKHCICI